MKIIINAFSSVKIALSFTEKHMEIVDESCVGDVLQSLFDEYNALAKMKGKLLFAVNEEYCKENTVLKEGDTLAIFPPVSGG